jgi:glycosyltransferase involved in cell wall biosynthesis
MMTFLRRRAAPLYHELRYRLGGEYLPQFLDLNDLPRLNRLLTDAGGQPLTAPPEPDPLLAERAMRMFELSPELRELFPLGLTPAQRGEFLSWAVAEKGGVYGVRQDEMLALLAMMDRTPDRGLERCYRLNAAWQRDVPDALTPAGWLRLKRALTEGYRLRGRWLEQAELPPQPDRTGPGVNVISHFDYQIGIQQAAVGLVAALHRAGVRTALRDLPLTFRPDPLAPRHLGVEEFDTSVIVLPIHTAAREWCHRFGMHFRPGVKRIALWYWEMAEIPEEWLQYMRWADEIWAPTRFLADTFRKYFNVPVVPVLPGVEPLTFTPLPRSRFGLADGRFTFLFTFDMGSVFERKNPLAVVAAFRRAFRPTEPVDLVIKMGRGDANTAALSQIQEACAAAGVKLIDQVWPREEVLALMNCADCYVSLHRTEGLGLGMAECMLLGKPVIGTGYSGNLDFMTAENSYLVRHTLVPVGADIPPYKEHQLWADPDVDHAAELMRRVYDHRDEAAAKGAQARRDLSARMSVDAYADRVRAALNLPAGV